MIAELNYSLGGIADLLLRESRELFKFFAYFQFNSVVFPAFKVSGLIQLKYSGRVLFKQFIEIAVDFVELFFLLVGFRIALSQQILELFF